MDLRSVFSSSRLILIGAFFGALAGATGFAPIHIVASALSEIFINLLKLVSLPIIFLSIVSTAAGMDSLAEVKNLGKRVLKYTIFTTVMAATIALVLLVTIQPAREIVPLEAASVTQEAGPGYWHFFMQMIPSNLVQPFVESNVIAVLFLALLFGLSILSLPSGNRKVLHTFFSSLYLAVMKVTEWIVCLMPIAVWAFVTLFVKELQAGFQMKSLLLYLICVIAANLIQAFIVLPLLLKAKGISPIRTAKGMLPALSIAFFSKSSSAALPMAMCCATEKVKLSPKVANFSFPLCTTMNMNGCAAFILTTVLFVSMSHGVVFSPVELLLWIVLATIAAVGNAGVPMGCFFLSSAFLAAMNIPLTMMGIILPFYSLIDMLESAINVWSDSCVATIVDKELAEQTSELPAAAPQPSA